MEGLPSPGFFAKLGLSPYAAGAARALTIAFTVVGPVVGGAILWFVDDVRTTSRDLRDGLVRVEQSVGTLNQYMAASAEREKTQDARLDKIEPKVDDLGNRMAVVEAKQTNRRAEK